MTAKRGRFETALLLSSGQTIGLAFGLLTPVLLSRWLTVDEFGTYRQMILFVWFANMTLHCGMDFGLFYFIRRNVHKASIFSLNASLVGFMAAVVFGLVLFFAREHIALQLNNPQLAELLPLIGILVVFSVPAQHLEHLLIVLDKPKYVVLHAAGQAMIQALLTIGLLYQYGTLHAVLLGLTVFAAVKLLLMLTVNLRIASQTQLNFAPWWREFVGQLRHSLPLGGTCLLAIVLQLDRFIIASLYSVATFARYAVGCFELPVLPGMVNNIHDLMSIDMVEEAKKKDYGAVFKIWLDSVARIVLLAVPIYLFFIVFAKPFIVTMFTEKYIDSAVYLQLFLVSSLLFAFDPELVIRAYGKTKLSMQVQIADTLLTIGCIAAGILAMGPLGALAGKAVSNLIVLVFKLKICARLMHVRLRDMIPVQVVLRTVLVSGLALIIAQTVAIAGTGWWSVVQLFCLGVAYALVFMLGARVVGLITPHDLRYIKARISAVLPSRLIVADG